MVGHKRGFSGPERNHDSDWPPNGWSRRKELKRQQRSLKENILGAGGVECTLHTPEDLSSYPQHPLNSQVWEPASVTPVLRVRRSQEDPEFAG